MLAKLKWSNVGAAVAYIVFGVCLLIWPSMTGALMCVLAGVALTISGVVKIIGHFSKQSEGINFRSDLPMGILYAILGVILLLHPETLIAAIPVVLGVMVLTNSVFKLQLALELRRVGYAAWWQTLLLAIASAALAVLMMTKPFASGVSMIVLLGVAIIVVGCCDLFTVLYVSKKLKALGKKLFS